MLNELRFVKGAVAAKDLVPGLTHFRIQDGLVRSYNGAIAMCSPIALDLDCAPKANEMVKAISNCEDTTTVSLTPSGRLSIRSGAFRALVPTIGGETPHVYPAGEPVALDGAALLKAFQILEPFIGTDASRPFANGILLSHGSAFATNNVVMAQYWLACNLPRDVNVPRKAVKEVLRIGEPPVSAQLDADSITFHYGGGRWIRSQLIGDAWPTERVLKLLDQPCQPVAIDKALFVGLAKLESMADGAGRVYLQDGALRTSLTEDEGHTYELDVQFKGCYNMKMLGLLEGVVDTADMTLYPGPCLFFGDKLRGAIVGMSM